MSKSIGNVIQFPGQTSLDLPCDKVLEGAMGQLEDVIVLGWDKEESLYFAMSSSDGTELLWLLEKAKQLILKD